MWTFASGAEAAAVDPVLVSMARGAAGLDVIVGLEKSEYPVGASRAVIRARQAAVLSVLPSRDILVRHRYESIAGLAARVTPAGLESLAAHPDVAWIAPDIPGFGALEESIPQIRADRVHDHFITGSGVVVAVIDSGVDAEHPDIAGSVIHEECFCNGNCDEGAGVFCRPDCCPDGTARQSGPGSAAAGHPHGTHVSGILLSRGEIAGVGVAPAASLIAIRVLDASNRGSVSDWLAALDWLAVHRPDVRVVNMSLSSARVFRGDCAVQCELDCRPQDGCDVDTVCGINRMLADVVARLRRRGTVVVAASGNSSRDDGLSSPACVTGVLSVGAVDGNDDVAFFSNAGSELDLLAPGIDVVSSLPGGGRGQFCGTVGGQQVCGGTSMAAPHVAGTAALLAAAAPAASAAAIEAAIAGTGVAVLDPRNGRSYPRVDAAAAFREITRVREIDPGGGSVRSDCLLGWNFLPPDIVRRRRNPVARCRDGDRICDADSITGQCTFLLSLCFNLNDPLLPFCAVDEPIVALDVREPSARAPAGSTERRNADALLATLPPLPLAGADLCTQAVPIIVRRDEGSGISRMRLRARTATRTDTDVFVLECEAP